MIIDQFFDLYKVHGILDMHKMYSQCCVKIAATLKAEIEEEKII